MTLSNSLLDGNYSSDELIYDCIVIGTGTSSEPVIYHLSKTSFKTLIIDGSDLYKEYKSIDQNKRTYDYNITPKQIFSDLKIHNNFNKVKLKSNISLTCSNFSYIYSYVSGGLSNFWGGGLFEWPESEIKKTTSIPHDLIKKSYANISKRLCILDRNQFFKKSSFTNLFLEKHANLVPNIFQLSKFFISKESLKGHKEKRDYFDQNIIWKSSNTIKKYINNSQNIKYLPNTSALSIKKMDSRNIIYCLQGNKHIILKAKSVFLCAGVINSTYLAFSALEKKKADFRINHSFAAIVPVLYFGLLPRFQKDNLELPELSWSLIPKGTNISGYLISSYFLNKKLSRLFNSIFFKRLNKFIEKLLSSISFITIFTDSSETNTYLSIEKIPNKVYEHDDFSLKIINKNSPKAKQRIISRELNKLRKVFNFKFFLIKCLTQFAKNGGDIHYGSTMPEKNAMKNSICTNSIGELNNAKNIFVCDPSRMGYISSLPHTFTSMAIVDSSMPMIVKKLNHKELRD